MTKFWELDISIEDMNNYDLADENMKKIQRHELLTLLVYAPTMFIAYHILGVFYRVTKIDLRSFILEDH